MALHLVLSRGETAARPARLALAEGTMIEDLRVVDRTDDPAEFCAVLRVILDGGKAPHPRIEREWGPQLREIHARVAAASAVCGPLGQRLQVVELTPPAGPDKQAQQ
jgi:hypothetical protein